MSLNLTEQEKTKLFEEFPCGVTYQDDILHLVYMVIEVLAARGLPEELELALNEMENDGKAVFAVRELAAQNVAQAATIKALADALQKGSAGLGRLGTSSGVGGVVRQVALGIKGPIDDALRIVSR